MCATSNDDDEAINVDDVWLDLVKKNIVGQGDTFKGFMNDDCDTVCEQADTDKAIVAAVQDRGDGASDASHSISQNRYWSLCD